jgi:putative transposase
MQGSPTDLAAHSRAGNYASCRRSGERAGVWKRVGRKALREIACVAKPDTILAWYRKLIAQKFDGSKHRQYPGRPRVDGAFDALAVRMARENSGWGYDRIVGVYHGAGGRTQ